MIRKATNLAFFFVFLLPCRHGAIKQTYSNETIEPSAETVKQAEAAATVSHLKRKLSPGEPEMPQGACVTGAGVSGCNLAGMKEEPKACQLHSQQAGYPPPPATRRNPGAEGRFSQVAQKDLSKTTFNNSNKKEAKFLAYKQSNVQTDVSCLLFLEWPVFNEREPRKTCTGANRKCYSGLFPQVNGLTRG